VPLGTGEFEEAWPRIVRALASFTGSLDVAEEYAAEAVARATAHERDDGAPIESYAAWCTSVARRAWLDDVRRRAVERRLAPRLAHPEVVDLPEPTADRAAMDAHELSHEGLDDRLALLFVACDEALSPASRMVLALRVVCGLTVPEIAGHLGIQETAAAARLTRAKRALAEARGTFRVPDASERERRLPVVTACVAGMFTVAHRTVLEPADAVADTGRQALSIADALVATQPNDTEVRGLRAVIRLGLARRPGRVDADGTGLALDEVDRRRWDLDLLRGGLADATFAASGDGRFAIESAIAGLHTSAPSFERTDWQAVVLLYTALEQRWPSPSVRVARLVATAHAELAEDPTARDPGVLTEVEAQLRRLATAAPAYASRDAALALADLEWRTGRRQAAAERYLDLADVMAPEPLRRFCLRRASGAGAAGLGPAGRPRGSALTGRVHDEADPDEADERPGDVEAVGPEAVDHHAPEQRPGDEDPAVGREDAAEARVGLQGGDEAVEPEGDDPTADPEPPPVLAHPLPHEPGTADLGERGEDEEQERAGDGHGDHRRTGG
jgi:RNA polymerase sigma factor (sigma-70 family)